MTAWRRALWLAPHLAWSALALCWWTLRRRGRAALVLTHHGDVDGRGRDAQMGPLVQALGDRALELVLAPLSREGAACWRRRGLFVSYAALAAAARARHPFARGRERALAARTAAAVWMLRLLRPVAVFAIDESASGQPLVRAARRLGIRCVGVQHGDFTADNPQYAPVPGRAFDVVPADALCVWSPWFAARLRAISPIYRDADVAVTGRMRWPASAGGPTADARVRVLVVEQADPPLHRAAAAFLAAVRGDPRLLVAVQPHPAAGERPPPLGEALAACDVVLGSRSSALLEALWHRRPLVVVPSADCADPRGLVAAGLARGCRDPRHVAAACIAAADAENAVDAARRQVWGGAPADPVAAVLTAGGIGPCAPPAATSAPDAAGGGYSGDARSDDGPHRVPEPEV